MPPKVSFSIPANSRSIRGKYISPITPVKELSKRASRTVEIYTSEWVENFVNIKNADSGTIESIDFSKRRYLRRFYDSPSENMLFMTSRQTEKSTTLGNRFLALLGTRRNYPALFVTPSAMQTMVFSRTRIDDIVDISPVIKALRGEGNLLEKRFKNGSVGYLRYAFLNADRIRGISALALFADEIQDLLPEVMPVIEEVTSHHAEPKIIYSGTPKTYDNTIEKYWQLSTQSEWVIPCERHGVPKDRATWHWNILGEKNIGKEGPVCSRCSKPISAEHPQAQWVAMAPDNKKFEGLRICRLMVPWYVNNPKRWADLLHQRERYSRDKFLNEVLALSFDGGQKPISRHDMIRACDSRFHNSIEDALKYRDQTMLFAGIDWGPGTENSYTVMSIGGYVRDDDAMQVLLSIRFEGPLADPEPQLKEILKLIALFRIRIVGTDFGFGFTQNKRLVSALGPERVVQNQYQSKLMAKVVIKPATHRQLVFRTPVMSDIIYAIQTGRKIRFPSFASYERPFADDFLALRAEYSNQLRMTQYTKPSNATDDTFHSVLFMMMASFRIKPRPDIMAPLKDPLDAQSKVAAAEEAALKYLESVADHYDY